MVSAKIKQNTIAIDQINDEDEAPEVKIAVAFDTDNNSDSTAEK